MWFSCRHYILLKPMQRFTAMCSIYDVDVTNFFVQKLAKMSAILVLSWSSHWCGRHSRRPINCIVCKLLRCIPVYYRFGLYFVCAATVCNTVE